jgi:hypothetical protein
VGVVSGPIANLAGPIGELAFDLYPVICVFVVMIGVCRDRFPNGSLEWRLMITGSCIALVGVVADLVKLAASR